MGEQPMAFSLVSSPSLKTMSTRNSILPTIFKRLGFHNWEMSELLSGNVAFPGFPPKWFAFSDNGISEKNVVIVPDFLPPAFIWNNEIRYHVTYKEVTESDIVKSEKLSKIFEYSIDEASEDGDNRISEGANSLVVTVANSKWNSGEELNRNHLSSFSPNSKKKLRIVVYLHLYIHKGVCPGNTSSTPSGIGVKKLLCKRKELLAKEQIRV